jgi:hypothetical protein
MNATVCGGCLQVIDFKRCGGLRRFNAAVAAVARNLLKTLVRRFCGGLRGFPPIPPYTPKGFLGGEHLGVGQSYFERRITMAENLNLIYASANFIAFRKSLDGRPYTHCLQVADFLRMDCDELQRIVREYRGSVRFRRENFIPAKAISGRRLGKGARVVLLTLGAYQNDGAGEIRPGINALMIQ